MRACFVRLLFTFVYFVYVFLTFSCTMNVRKDGGVQKRGQRKTMQEKLNIIKKLTHSSQSISDLAHEQGVDVSTIHKWIKDRDRIEQWCESFEKGDKSGYRQMLTAKNTDLEEVLFLWFSQCRNHGVPLSGPIVKNKALLLNEKMGGNESFVASDGWLSRWKRRYGIRQISICEEKLSADLSVTEEFIEKFQSVIEEKGLTRDQVFNCDETGLNFKMLPTKTLVRQSEKSAPGFKKNKERLTVMACCNVSGSLKLPLMVIGKSKKPRAFKHINPENLPVFYRIQTSAWMNSALFEEWCELQFIPKVQEFLEEQKLPPKALLIVDNAPSHSQGKCFEKGEISLMFLPPNVTSVLQPMDQGVLENLKRRYRFRLLSSILKAQDDDTAVIEHLKKINILDVIYWLSEAWDDVSPSAIQNSWDKLWPPNTVVSRNCSEAGTCSNTDLADLVNRIQGLDNTTEEGVASWICHDNFEVEYLSDEEIIRRVAELNHQNEDENPSNDQENLQQKIDATEFQECLRKVTIYCEQKNAKPEYLAVLHELRQL